MKPQNQIKERPILFSAPMIRAILSGNKTQTRRVVKPQPKEVLAQIGEGKAPSWAIVCSTPATGVVINEYGNEGWLRSPYGYPGDILWVRETAGIVESEKVYGAEGIATTIETWAYRATNPDAPVERWKSSIHMPKEAARIWLRVKAVRVERLQDISEADAKAEGMTGDCQVGYIPAYQKAPLSYHFATVWEDINGAESWAENPFVWVVEFEVLSTTGKPKN